MKQGTKIVLAFGGFITVLFILGIVIMTLSSKGIL